MRPVGQQRRARFGGLVRCGSLALAAAVVGLAPAATAQAQELPDPEVYEVEGVRVVHLPDPGREVVAVRLYLLGGVKEHTLETAGAERLILMASERGTVGYPGEELLRAQVRTGSRFFSSAAADWSVVGFTGLAEQFRESWRILSDRIVRPTLDPSVVELVRAQALTSVRVLDDDPDTRARRLGQSSAYWAHPYRIEVNGSEESLTTLTVDQLRAYHAERFVRSRMLVSVVGAVGRPEVEEAVRATLADLPSGSYTWSMPPRWTSLRNEATIEPRALPTNYLAGYFSGPRADSDDYEAFRVAVAVLSGVISAEIRSRGLSYSAGVSLVDRAATGGVIYVSTVDPDEAMRIINDVISLFSGGSLPRSVIRSYAEDSALEYYLLNQTSSSQADFLATSLLLGGSLRTVDDWVQSIRDVGGYDVRRAIEEYVLNIQWGYLGSELRFPRDRLDLD